MQSFLIKFLQNLLMGEHHELKNRYMLIGDSEFPTHTSTHTSKEENTHTSTHTSKQENSHTNTPQVPHKHPTSTGNILLPKSENVRNLVSVLGSGEMTVKEMMDAVGLKNRPNFMDYSLNPAIAEGLVRMLYPQSPRHPRQRYLLTVKGTMIYSQLQA